MCGCGEGVCGCVTCMRGGCVWLWGGCVWLCDLHERRVCVVVGMVCVVV